MHTFTSRAHLKRKLISLLKIVFGQHGSKNEKRIKWEKFRIHLQRNERNVCEKWKINAGYKVCWPYFMLLLESCEKIDTGYDRSALQLFDTVILGATIYRTYKRTHTNTQSVTENAIYSAFGIWMPNWKEQPMFFMSANRLKRKTHIFSRII